jgi:cell division protease FtsH
MQARFQISKSCLYILIGAIVLAVIYSVMFAAWEKPKEVNISDVVSQVNTGQVEKIIVEDNKLTIELKNGEKEIAFKESDASLVKDYNLDTSKAKIEVKDTSSGALWLNIISAVLPVLLIGGFLWFMMKQAQSGNNQAMAFGKSRARMVVPTKKKITFKDVAGSEEAKQELLEVVEFLKHGEKFRNLGAEIPKGVLLLGPPGTGKTLLAKAVAGEADVPFFSISGSEFVEMFVGVGASRVRDLFARAKKNAPAIVFIDEIDAVGRQRGAGLGGGNDEREQTLNQILVEMDGFETDTNVIVMAATNRPDVLDPALLRPGRFDRRVVLDLPDIKEREMILKVHARNKPLEKKVDLARVAKQTSGFSGADLRNLMNEAAILAARRNKDKIGTEEILESIEKVMLGPERKSHLLSDREKKITAYHEAGHALVSKLLPNCSPVRKISIISRGMAAGYTWNVPEEDRHLFTRSDFADNLAAMMGGRAAEEIVFGESSTGAENDLRKATEIARDLVKDYGMSEKLGPATWGHKDEFVFLGKEMAEQRNYSEKTAACIDEEIQNLLSSAFKRARKVIMQNRSKLDIIAKTLIEREILEGEEFETLLHGRKIIAKKASYADNANQSNNEIKKKKNSKKARQPTGIGKI